jgi:hypothetical protein
VARGSPDPSWSMAIAVFYRKEPRTPIEIELWNKNMVMMDSFLGQANLVAPVSSESKNFVLELFGRNDKASEKMPGSLNIEAESYNDMTAL